MMQKRHATVQEVGMRDGLQSVSGIMPTHDKKRWIDAAYVAGVRYMEVASYVPAKLLPQMADADEVVAHALTYGDLTVTALVPNLKGAEKALAAGVHRIVAPISVSVAHSMANVRKTPADMVEEFRRIRELRDDMDKVGRTKLIAGLSTVFGCTLQGEVPLEDVQDIVLRVLDAGSDIVALADTTGHATPGQVDRFFDALIPQAQGKLTIAHFHDTRGMALPNTMIALQHGIHEFDASLAGLGGCPHAPGATGNVATEDLVFMLESLGYHTGIDVQQLLDARSIIQQALPQAVMYGSLAHAGLPKAYSKQSNIEKAVV
ncbi:hydroxymethylglutaryl-CoA lyase [Noviherbaspirillum saxi]|uniref:Hydroxymethylglutaryl-CoA lyase n=1 Tax=Noviherbaspirillum saxi TaxID=2320863 RepID=A0A3A3FI18_9BURK|nr:hydroxymethylglutaryl-CoA lyase [Noviherbaspirillum saxi]RJF92038.1 hydroxymethylglutaryl-CoA lyase [Noviherbaspirillum saxi]